MERRSSRRIIVSIRSELISEDNSYAGMIENLSEEGLYIITAPTNTPMDFTSDSKLRIKCAPQEGKTLDLRCRLIWMYDTPPHGLTKSIGLEIVNPPPEYKEFLDSQK